MSEEKEWHVWQVGYYFYAAYTLEEAIEFYCNDYGDDRSEVDFDDTHCDYADYYNDIEVGENGGEPTCSMRQQAEHLIKSGQSMPFEFARLID